MLFPALFSVRVDVRFVSDGDFPRRLQGLLFQVGKRRVVYLADFISAFLNIFFVLLGIGTDLLFGPKADGQIVQQGLQEKALAAVELLEAEEAGVDGIEIVLEGFFEDAVLLFALLAFLHIVEVDSVADKDVVGI